MDNFYTNIYKIIESVGMCDKHKNDLVAKLTDYFKNNQYDSSFVFEDESKNEGGGCGGNCKCASK